MNSWLEKIGYGNRDTSAGLDVFWLPTPGRKTLLISPREQAELMSRLATKKLPFSAKTQFILQEVMLARKTERGALYGKTGTGTDGQGNYVMGWFVGYVESPGKTYAFACLLKGEKVMGKDARAVVEKVLTEQGLL